MANARDMNPPPIPRNAITRKLILEIEGLVEQSAVTDALMTLAKAVNSPRELKILGALDVLHETDHHLADDVRKRRSGVYSALLARAMRATDDATYMDLVRAFGPLNAR